MEQLILIESWAAVSNYEEFEDAVLDYFDRAGTAFSAAYYRLLRYSMSEAILQELSAERSWQLPAIPVERPRGYYDVREAVSDHGGRAILRAIVDVTRSEYMSANEQQGSALPAVYVNRLLEEWSKGLRSALQSEASDLRALCDYLEGRYDEYYEALQDERCGRTWLGSDVRVEELAWAVYGGRKHVEFVREYGLADDEPPEIRELLDGDED